ncbi:MAG: bifunctional 5,10-methylenetetrahydrofolate dehydrogenase/5,10-methenyltetrahydrofolate cyclohydrolase [Patescibacteria group bacterium]|nr:bifunctional 5,10-methylenetetrahydrofolate dehydrogenase/5,10-methenyltetrahydrofolate cyclohydrolase [Patescibacteria group bacterium]MDE1944149.1 bifunctional 5,10-methylenetetrahydrofolate dehydrogenase/5,10-methenyltetrahydrofolate cyclohydrolase [Patescibacteria group bacterium]MDE1945238.1 bifunctional 5,10-methylenetetrahydrofolate dehydrogenase/5,10-methenyltetrahydrofolate cyclohydrolase [Patescibacteria group bacterium]MDE2057949.1 bifunctional 5,10-methylenetetrahydrofolate dehydr
MILDGKALAAEILDEVGQRAIALGTLPRLAIVAANPTPATRSYLAAKARAARQAGCALEVIELPETASALELRLAIDSAAADAVVLQLPLADDRIAKEACDGIPPEKDADVLSTVARMRFEADEDGALVPPVAGALAAILDRHGVNPEGKRAVVLGDGWLVGKPCATWLAHQGADVIHLKGPASDLAELRLADIIVSGVGSPHLIQPELIKEGVVLVDAGTSEMGGKLAGDAAPACAPMCALFTPCPGGVGPVAVAKLFENVVALAERATHR